MLTLVQGQIKTKSGWMLLFRKGPICF